MIDAIIQVWESNSLTTRTIEHLTMFSIAISLASIIGISMGILIFLNPKITHPLLNLLNLVETIPDIPLLIILMPIFGLGSGPTIVASVLYSLLPITRNTYTGLKEVEQKYVDIALALGLSKTDILFKVRIPLSLPTIIGGLRIALVFTMGIVTLGGLIAAGGLGAVLIAAIQLYNINLILVAGLWTGLLAVIFDNFAGRIEQHLQRMYGIW